MLLYKHIFIGFKTFYWISYLGLCVCIAGEVLRKTAMLTAKSNFNHLVTSVIKNLFFFYFNLFIQVQCEKNEGHKLVTHGVYGMFRHPSYVGWFYWSIGTQVKTKYIPLDL